MGMTKPDIQDALLKRRTAFLFDDFNYYTSGGHLTTTKTSVGGESAAAGNYDGGGLVLTTGGTVNNESAVWTTNKLWTFANLKPIIFEVCLNYIDADTNNAALAFGLTSNNTVTTGVMADTTFAVQTNFSGCLIYKKPGDTLWSVRTSVGTTQQDTQSSTPCQGIAAGLNQILQIQLMVLNGYVEATFQIGLQGIGGGGTGGMTNSGQLPALLPVGVAGSFPSRQIKHNISITSAASMYAGMFAKTGTGGISQTPTVDYIGVAALTRP